MVHCVYKWHCYVCYLLQHRGFTTMHYMNLRINYLLTCDVMHSRIWFIGLGRFGYFNFGSVWFSYQSRILSFLWSPYGIGQTIIFSCCDFYVSSCFFSSPNQPQIGCVPFFHTWCGLSANLRCKSETCCTRLAWKHRTQKSRQKSPSGHHRTTLSAISLQLRHISTIRK